MPIDEREVRTVKTPTVILEDRSCTGCGYSLRGLRTDGKCPECGRPIRKPTSRLSTADDLTHAPVQWLRSLSISAQCLLWGFLGLLAAWIFAAFAQSPYFWGVLFFPALLLTWGVLGVTVPRPVMPSSQLPPGREWAKLRLATRVCALGWLIMAGSIVGRLTVFQTGPMQTVAFVTSLVGFAVGIVGLVLLLAYLSGLADWGNDITLVFRLRASMWIVGAGGLAYLIANLVISGGVAIVEGIVLAACLLLLVASMFSSVLSLYQFSALANWAVINHMTDLARTERMREKVERARRVQQDAIGVAVPTQTSKSSTSPKQRASSGSNPSTDNRSTSAGKTEAESAPDDGLYHLEPSDDEPTDRRL